MLYNLKLLFQKIEFGTHFPHVCLVVSGTSFWIKNEKNPPGGNCCRVTWGDVFVWGFLFSLELNDFGYLFCESGWVSRFCAVASGSRFCAVAASSPFCAVESTPFGGGGWGSSNIVSKNIVELFFWIDQNFVQPRCWWCSKKCHIGSVGFSSYNLSILDYPCLGFN